MVIYLENIEDNRMNFIEKIIIFLEIFFKYLITYGVSDIFLCLYLIILITIVLVDLYKRKMYVSELKNILIFGLIACYFIIFYFEQNFLISFLLAIVCLNRNDKDFLKNFFYSSIICFVFTLILNLMGILEVDNIIRNVNGVIIARYTLGFRHPNEVFLFFLPIVLSGFCLFSDKKMFYILTIISASLLYKFTDSRTGFYVVIIFLIFVLFRKIFTKKLIKKAIPVLFLILTIFSIFLAMFYGENRNNKISRILSGRPYYWNYYVENETLITPFGNNIVEEQVIDNFYIYLLVQLGLVGYIIYFIIYYVSLKNLNYDYKYLIVATIFLIYGLFEANTIIGSIQFLFAIQLKSIIKNKNRSKINDVQY